MPDDTYKPVLPYPELYEEAKPAKQQVPERGHAAMDDLIEAYRLAALHVDSKDAERTALENIRVQEDIVYKAVRNPQIMANIDFFAKTAKMQLYAVQIIEYGRVLPEPTPESRAEALAVFKELDAEDPVSPQRPPTDEEIVEDFLQHLPRPPDPKPP